MSLPGEDENPTAAVSWNLEAVFNATTLEPDINLAVYDQNQQAIGTARIRPSLDKPFHGWLRLMDASNTSKRKMPLVGEIFVQYICRSSTEVMYRPEDFEILHLIGKGSRGRVYQVRKRDTKRLYAMKVFRKEKILNKHDALRERTILATVSGCSFVTNLKFAFQTTTTLHLVMDFHAGGDLSSHQLRQEKGFFDEATAKFYIAEVILALQNLHEHGIIHCSLRPEDILLGADGHIVLVDFGLAIDNIRGLGGGVGLSEVNEFIAPELYLDSGGYTPVVDFWSLGVVAFELSCGWNPFYGEDAQEICKKICMEKVRFPRNRVSAEFKSFIKVLLHRNPKVRLGADHGCKELKDHPAMADIDWDRLSRKQFDPPFKPQLSSDGDVSYFGTNLTGASSAIAWSDEGAAAITSSQQALFDGFDYAYETALIDDMNSILQL
ncbi:kinase-like protein [Thozetella sp. PMI_491]|nr:kinase-like protein [Thozetella sp. PMI_491]